MKEKKERAARNRTICLSANEEKTYFERCIKEETLTKNIEPTLSPLIDKTIFGDCITVLSKLPEKVVDLLIVDPPYNLDKKFGSSSFRKMGTSEYEDFTKKWINAVIPLLKDTASIYICCDWKSSVIIGSLLSDYFIIRNRISWQREKGRGAKTNWKNSMEDIWFATMSNDYTFNAEAVKQRRKVIAPYKVEGKPKDWVETKTGNYRDTFPSNFWDDISIPYWSMPENTDHPTQKPEKLLAKLILASSNEKDIVLDPFVGTGTTSVVSKKLGRHFIGIEKEKEYCALAEKRLEIAEDSDSIQGYFDNVFWERNTLADQQKWDKSK